MKNLLGKSFSQMRFENPIWAWNFFKNIAHCIKRWNCLIWYPDITKALGALFNCYTFFNACIFCILLDPHKDVRERVKYLVSVSIFLGVHKIFWCRHFLTLTECWTASISWYRYNRISAYGSIQTTPCWRSQVRLYMLLISLGAILNFLFMTSFAERLQPPCLSFDSRDSTMSGREAKSGHYESLYSILFLYKH